MKINGTEFAGDMSGVCECGARHSAVSEELFCGPGARERLSELLRGYKSALLICDPNTYEAYGAEVMRILRSCTGARLLVLQRRDLHADESAVGETVMALDEGADAVLSLGSGTLNDIGKYCAALCARPYISVASAASMDGYASGVAALLRAGVKTTFNAVPPRAIVCDTDIMASAPRIMAAAGFGDIVGKYNALEDWRLSEVGIGECRCERICAMTREAVRKAEGAASGLAEGGAEALSALAEALCISGVAMQLQGNSRPASGAEHHLAHFLEMRDNAAGRHSTLHGDKVGVAALMCARVYEILFDGTPSRARADFDTEKRRLERAFGAQAQKIIEANEGLYRDEAENDAIVERIMERGDEFRDAARQMRSATERAQTLIKAAGGPVRARELGYTREDIRDALLCAKAVRERFTVLRLASLMGREEEIAERVTDEFC